MTTVGPEIHRIPSTDDAVEYCFAQGWTDGLPVVPPERGKVARMIAASGRAPDEVVVEYPERSRFVTVESVAANAVMAGCLPEYLPVVIAILEGMSDPAYKLHPTLTSTGGTAPGFVLNGPVRRRLHMNTRGNVLGPGNRANSTIGRAVRLTIVNSLGAVPGAGNEGTEVAGPRPVLDQSTVGTLAKYTGFHIVEDEEAVPALEPLHVQRGYRPEESVVTCFSSFGHLFIAASPDGDAESLMDTICHYLLGSGRLRNDGWCILVIPPECGETFVRDGWSKDDIAATVVRETTRSMAWMKEHGESVDANLKSRRGGIVEAADHLATVGIADTPEDVSVVVAGSPTGRFIHAILPYAPFGLGSGMTSRRVVFPS